MPAFLRENLPYKLLALAFAVLLHFYVVSQQTPGRLMTVPLTLRNQPPDVLLDSDSPRQVTLTLNGSQDQLDHVALTDVTASVDLAHARPGKRVSLPVQVKAPDDLQASVSPDVVTLNLLARQTRRLAVAAADPGPPLPGYQFLPPRITPRLVAVSGDAADVASIVRLVARVDVGTVGTVDDDYDIVALDAQGGEVSSVALSPPRAHVSIRMVRAPAQKNVLVSADITGAPSPSARVGSIEVHPYTLVVAGRPERLAQIDTIVTTPVDISGAISDVTRTVNCLAPPGVTFSGASAVVVTVHISLQGGTAPASVPAVPLPSIPAAPGGTPAPAPPGAVPTP